MKRIEVELIKQPNAYSCGNACLKMALNKISKNDIDILDLIKICKTNKRYGTRHTEMILGLEHYDVDYIRNTELRTPEEQLEYLKNVIDNGNIFLLRTLTLGIKHWIVICGAGENEYIANDPWLGEKTYDSDYILKIWEPREFDGFEILLNNK